VIRATRIAAETTRLCGDGSAADREGEEEAGVVMVEEIVGEGGARIVSRGVSPGLPGLPG